MWFEKAAIDRENDGLWNTKKDTFEYCKDVEMLFRLRHWDETKDCSQSHGACADDHLPVEVVTEGSDHDQDRQVS